MTLRFKILLYISVLFISAGAFGQNAQLYSIDSKSIHNITDFTPVRIFQNSEVSQANSNESNHPELGRLFPNAPCDSCYEVLSERTVFTKKFLKAGTNGTEFFLQQGMDPLHYLGEDGNLLTVNSNLSPAGNGKYQALNQVNKIQINTQEGYVDFGTDNKKIKYNHNLTLWGVTANGEEQHLASANWSDYTVGDEGMEVKNIFPGIDLLMIVTTGKIKTSFVLNQKLSQLLQFERIIIKDDAQLIGENLQFASSNSSNKTVVVQDLNGEQIFNFGRAVIIYNNSTRDESLQGNRDFLPPLGSYKYENNSLDLIVDKELLDVSESFYPLLIDPLLQANATTNVYGSGYDFTCSSPYTGCIYNMTIMVPAAVQLTDLILNSFSYYAWPYLPCWMADGAAEISLGSCSASLQCYDFYSGECMATANQSVTTFYQSCFPAPTCSSYPLNFTLNLYRCYDNFPGCDDFCIEGWQPWIMTIQGRTLETQNVGISAGNSTICSGSSTQVGATGQYGVPPYSVTWNPGGINGTPATVSPTSTTTYTATITDLCGSTASGSVTVTVVPSPTASASANSPLCPGQTINLTGSGGGNYSWTGPNGFTSNLQNPTIPNASSANQGVYILTVSNGSCSNQDTVQVVIGSTNPVSASSNSPICEGQTLNLTASGGISYSWTGPNGFTSTQQNPTIPNATPTTAGTYSVIISSSDCPTTVDVVVTVNPNPTTPNINIGSPTCLANGTATVSNYNSSQTYTFTPSGPSVGAGGAISGATPGTNYSITTTNSNGCASTTATFTIQAQYPTPSTPTINTAPPSCSADGTSTISNYNSAHTYTFTPSGPAAGAGGIISGATPGTNYTVIATSSDGCTSQSSAFTNLPQLPVPSAPNLSVGTPTCTSGGSVTITDYNSAYTYTFSPTGPSIGSGGIITGTTQGTSYTVTATNSDGCASTASSFSVQQQLSTPSDAIINTTNPSCLADGSSIISNFDSNYIYTFSPTGPSVGPNGAVTGATLGTSYTVTVTNSDGCTSSVVSFVNQPQLSAPTLSVNAINAATCGTNGSLEFTFTGIPDGSYTISYDGGTFNITLINGSASVSAPPGNYDNITIVLTGCNNLPIDAVILEPATPITPSVVSVSADCNMSGESLIANFNNNYTYTFTPSGPTVDPATGQILNANYGQNYSVIAYENGCDSNPTSFMNEAQYPTPTVSVSADNALICEGDMAVLTATSNDNTTTFTWSNGLGSGAMQTDFPSSTTNYTVTGTNSYGCEDEATVTVSVTAIEQPTFTGDNLLGCVSHSVNFTSNITSSSGVKCLWDFGDGATSSSCSNTSHLYTSSGEFTVSLTITNQAGCSSSFTITDYVTVVPKPVAFFTANPTTVDLSDTEVQFTNNSKDATSYTWNFGDGSAESNGVDVNHSFPNTSIGDYIVTLIASNEAGCEDTYSVAIKAEEDLIFYVPNSFTPDNDNFNEIFLPVITAGYDPEDYSLFIYNRWGEIMFESHDTTVGWDGTYGGKLMQDGVYIWKISVKLRQKEERRTFSGHFNLLR